MKGGVVKSNRVKLAIIGNGSTLVILVRACAHAKRACVLACVRAGEVRVRAGCAYLRTRNGHNHVRVLICNMRAVLGLLACTVIGV